MYASLVQELSDAWCKLSAREVLKRAHKEFGDDLVVVCAPRKDTLPLLHLVSLTIPDTPVVFTGVLDGEGEHATLRAEILRRYPLNVVDTAPEETRDSARAWISGGRRRAEVGRSCDELVEVDPRGHIRINPLVAWTDTDIRLYGALNGFEDSPATA